MLVLLVPGVGMGGGVGVAPEVAFPACPYRPFQEETHPDRRAGPGESGKARPPWQDESRTRPGSPWEEEYPLAGSRDEGELKKALASEQAQARAALVEEQAGRARAQEEARARAKAQEEARTRAQAREEAPGKRQSPPERDSYRPGSKDDCCGR